MKVENKNVVFILIVGLIISLSSISYSQDSLSDEEAKLLKSRIEKVQTVAAIPPLIEAVKLQNSKNIPLSDVVLLDKKWRAGDQDVINSVLETKISRILMQKIKHNVAIYSEAFLCDDLGANVAAYPATSDYWQGDEAKWFNVWTEDGKGEVVVGDVEYDESSKVKTVQISVPVLDEGVSIGVLVMGVKLSFLVNSGTDQ